MDSTQSSHTLPTGPFDVGVLASHRAGTKLRRATYHHHPGTQLTDLTQNPHNGGNGFPRGPSASTQTQETRKYF